MGICLDTDANTAQEPEENSGWKGGGVENQEQQRNSRQIHTPLNPGSVIQNTGKIKFDPPKVPVIFVLGGPGSGKVTHCDTLMQEKRGVTHINMMDLLQQYALGNDMQDFSQISSKTVTEVLMLEIKMAPAAKAYLISGFPRSMRDVVEYTEKIQVINGVVLISWRQSVLQKQIDYGAKLGHVVLSLAKMELENFFKNVMPVADYFDQSDMLVAVNGERAPSEVYKDFRAAVLEILGSLENQEAALNGVTGMGRGMNDIPGSIVSVETAPSQQKTIAESLAEGKSPIDGRGEGSAHNSANINRITSDDVDDASEIEKIDDSMGQRVNQNVPRTVPTSTTATLPTSNNSYPPIIWVVGGPGSNKGSLCLKAVAINPGWSHVSIGRLLRNIADSTHRANTENYKIKEALSAGEMVPEKSVEALLENNLEQNRDKKGLIIDGYPRNIQQVKQFEKKYKQRPPMILLDCSKLQLGRGRLDDTVSSFRRRLELFREQTLPMLKQLDNKNRLTIIDGDTDSPSVQREFEKSLRTHIQNLTESSLKNQQKFQRTLSTKTSLSKDDSIIEDLEENVPGTVPTISHHVSVTNGYLRNSGTNKKSTDNNIKLQQHINGNIPNGGLNFRQMLEEADPIDTYI